MCVHSFTYILLLLCAAAATCPSQRSLVLGLSLPVWIPFIIVLYIYGKFPATDNHLPNKVGTAGRPRRWLHHGELDDVIPNDVMVPGAVDSTLTFSNRIRTKILSSPLSQNSSSGGGETAPEHSINLLLLYIYIYSILHKRFF